MSCQVSERASSGQDISGENFLNRFERYAGDTEEGSCAKWGKVLAAEIRRRETFSAEVMCIVRRA